MCLRAAIAAIDSGVAQPVDWTKHFDLIRGAGYPKACKKLPLRSARVPEKSARPNGAIIYNDKLATTNGKVVNIEHIATSHAGSVEGQSKSKAAGNVYEMIPRGAHLSGLSA